MNKTSAVQWSFVDLWIAFTYTESTDIVGIHKHVVTCSYQMLDKHL